MCTFGMSPSFQVSISVITVPPDSSVPRNTEEGSSSTIPRSRRRRRYETSVEAYDLYLRARALPEQRMQGPAREAAGIYQQVIAKDPLFAPAYAGLAAALAASSAQGFENDHDDDDLARMRTAAEKAMQLDRS
jgi:hypothetical protein